MHPGPLPPGSHTNSTQTCEDPAYATQGTALLESLCSSPCFFPFPSLEVCALNMQYFLVYIVVSLESHSKGVVGGGELYSLHFPRREPQSKQGHLLLSLHY